MNMYSSLKGKTVLKSSRFWHRNTAISSPVQNKRAVGEQIKEEHHVCPHKIAFWCIAIVIWNAGKKTGSIIHCHLQWPVGRCLTSVLCGAKCAWTTETWAVSISASQCCTAPQGGDKLWVNFQADGKIRERTIRNILIHVVYGMPHIPHKIMKRIKLYQYSTLCLHFAFHY